MIVRLPRLFAKKRGHRRSGSQAWGSFGEGVFYGVLLIAGLVFGGLLAGRRFFGWRGRVALRWTLAGFVMLLLAYVGSSFVLEVILQRL